MGAGTGQVKLAFFPCFSVQESLEFTDQAHRALFYLRPVASRVAQIAIVRSFGMEVGSLPAYLDPVINGLWGNIGQKLRIVEERDAEQVFRDADYILHWDTRVALPPGLIGKSVHNVDRRRHVEECQDWLTLSSRIGGTHEYRVDVSRQRYRDVIAKHSANRCYIFGTGPGLSLAANHDYSDGVSIVCNSMVKNHELLDRLKPPLIVAADPIFHAGASVYASDFRAALYIAMERYGSYFICNQRDFRVFDAYMPEHLRPRLIGAPVGWGVRMRTDTTERFEFTACPNVLTLFLLPLAYAMSKREIFIAGCDGRSVDRNAYFWSHDKTVQFGDKMDAIQEAHPSFFAIDYNDYYFLHCETVASWAATARARGRIVVNMTPSHIPALRKCYIKLGDVDAGESIDEAIPFLMRLRMKQLFLHRQLVGFRRGVISRWRGAWQRRLTASH